MGHKQQGRTRFLRKLTKEPKNLQSTLLIEITRWLIGKYTGWLVNQGSCNGYALAFTPRQCRRSMLEPIGQTKSA
jgi:hypothetical protein